MKNESDKRPGGWPLGYHPPRNISKTLRSYCKTSWSRVVALAVGDHLCILLSLLICYWAWGNLPFSISLPLNIAGLLIIARSQRGLENLVHDGSHYNWTRGNKLMNDILTNWLAAFPGFNHVVMYRASHNDHHSQFGSAHDPDKRRYEELGLEAIDRKSLRGYANGMMRRIMPYIGSWYSSIRLSPRVIVAAITWHLVVVVLPLVLAFGLVPGLALWAGYWLLPMFTVLPLIRFIAEAGEHIYLDANDVFSATVSNVGWAHRLFFHPHGDGFHLMHHLVPGVPMWKLRRTHEFLVENDPFYANQHRFRLVVLQKPIPDKKLRVEVHAERLNPTA